MMRVSQAADCALRALVELARAGGDVPVPAGAVADRLRLPRRFCERQVTALARAGLVRCRRGGGGGCALARPASAITVADALRATEGSLLDAPRTSGSATAEAWLAAAVALGETLSSISIADLAARQSALDSESAPMYHI